MLIAILSEFLKVCHGVVGNGVAKILEEKKDLLEKKAGIRINLKRVFTRNWDKKFPYPISEKKKAFSLDELLQDDDIQIIVELTGGIDFPYSLMLSCIKEGKHIVTANKALLAEKGKELFIEAEKKGIRIGFEAAVAGERNGFRGYTAF